MTSNKIEIWTAGSSNTTSKRRSGGWAYLIRYEHRGLGQLEITASGNSWGTTRNQMGLMAVLNAIKRTNDLDRVTNEVVVYADSVWIYKCLSGVYDCYMRVAGDYLQEIGWAKGSLVVFYMYAFRHASDIGKHELVCNLAIQEQQKLED